MGSTLLLEGDVFDGEHFRDSMEIIVDSESGLITGFGRAGELKRPENAQVIKAKGIILPGFIDAHVHFFGSRKFDFREWNDTDPIVAALRSVKDTRNLLKAGFTTVRDLGSKCAVQLRRAIEEGDIPGPEIIPAGRSIAALGGDDDQKIYPLEIAQRLSYSSYCDGPWDCVRAVRREIRNGALAIKVYSGDRVTDFTNKPFLREDEIRAIAQEAHGLGARVTAHAYGEEGVMAAGRAGVDSIEHGFGLTEEICRLMAKSGISLVPTIAVHVINEKYMSGKWKEITDAHIKKDVPLAKKMGVRIALGTDFVGCDNEPHGRNYQEILNLHQAGLSIEESLAAATSSGAECLGLKDRGRIAEGMRADIVISGESAKDDLGSLAPEGIQCVIKKGKIVE